MHPILRAASLPGSEFVLPLITHTRLLDLGAAVGRALGKVGLQAGPDIAEGARGYASLNDAETRAAFLHTIRAVIDPAGQRISALDRLYLAESMPSLVIHGERDQIIPVAARRDRPRGDARQPAGDPPRRGPLPAAVGPGHGSHGC